MKKEGIDGSKDQRVRPDAERQRQNDGTGKARRAQQRPASVPQIASEVGQHGEQVDEK
jgi:hypothetical protein